MKNVLHKVKQSKIRRAIPALATTIVAFILIEGMALVNYRYTHNLLERELDNRAVSEMNMKGNRVRGILKSHEKIMINYVWDIQQNLSHPDSIYQVLRRIVTTNRQVEGSFVAFKPYYYPKYGRLFEPTVFRRISHNNPDNVKDPLHGDSIITKQMGGLEHDYTLSDFYRIAVEQETASWTDPYTDPNNPHQEITTFTMPISDATGQVIGAFGLDMFTRSIIDTINTIHDFPSTYFLLLTEGGKLISNPDSVDSTQLDINHIVRLVNDSTIEHKMNSNGRAYVTTFNDSIDGSLGYIYHTNLMGKPHWQLVMVCYDDEIFGKSNNMRRVSLFILLAVFSLLGVIMYLFNRNIRRLHDTKLKEERTNSELRIAQEIQSEMLPTHHITRPEVDISGSQVTALQVGGDLYDYFVRDEKLYFCIGDVSGKGVPSSLVMAVVHSLFRSLTQRESNPARIVQSINTNSCEGNHINMFVTLFVGVLDLPTGRLRYCNAGHDAPLVINSEVKALPVNANLPVGVISDFKYTQQQEELPSGTTLFLYTDGLTEAANESHRLYGLDRIIATAQQCQRQGQISPEQMMNAMHLSVTTFVGSATQSDDLTMLALHYRQPEEKVILLDSITLPNDVHTVPQLNQFIQTACQRLNLESSMVSQLMLAVEEAVVNVMNYAYPIGTQGDVNITIQGTDKDIKVIISDSGKAFDPTATNKADTTLSAEDRPIGGLGILLVHQLMDSINYERSNGKNVLTLKKNYQPE